MCHVKTHQQVSKPITGGNITGSIGNSATRRMGNGLKRGEPGES